MDDDIDWEALALAPAAPLALAGVADAPAAPLALAGVWKGWRQQLPCPQNRTRPQQLLAAGRMREARAAYRQARSHEQIIGSVNQALESFRSAGVLLDRRLRLAPCKLGGIVVKGCSFQVKRLPCSAMQAIAFSSVNGRNDVARQYKLGAKTITRVITVVAHCTMSCDISFMRGLAQYFDAHPPLIFVSSMASDATKQKLRFAVSAGLPASASRSSWGCLVSRHKFMWCFPGSETWFQIEFVRPNVPISGDSGEVLFDGLYGLPQVASFRALEDAGARRGDVAILHFDIDGHPANMRTVAGRRATLPAGLLVSARHCGNHATNLVEGYIITAAEHGGERVLPWLYSATLFLGMGGNYIRLVQSVASLVQKYLPAPAAGDILPPDLTTTEIMDYSITNYKAYSDAMAHDTWSSDEELDEDEGEPRRGKPGLPRHRAFERAWADFTSFFNAKFWVDKEGSEGLVGHTCSSAECCGGYNLTIARARAAKVIARLLYRVMPTTPTKGKWTKLGGCLDWFLLSMGTMNILRLTFPLAYGRVDLAATSSAMDLISDDHVYVSDINWHSVQGKRRRSFEAGLNRPPTLVSVIVLSIVLEPLRWLTRWFMRRTSVVRRLRAQQLRRPAPICDLVWLPASPAVRVLQYYSHLLSGQASRLVLVWGRSYESFAEWAASEVDSLALLRRVCMAASAWVHFRHLQGSMCYPWLLAGLVDGRRSMADRSALAKAFADSPADVLDAWFGAPLQARIDDKGDLFEQKWQQALWIWSWQITLSIAQVEFTHGRDRARSHANESWGNFCAQTYNNENHLRLQRQYASMQRRQGVGRDPPKQKEAPAKRRKKVSAMEVCRREMIDGRKAIGIKVNVATAGFWNDFREEWTAAQADPVRLRRLQQEAEQRNEARPAVALQAAPPLAVADAAGAVGAAAASWAMLPLKSPTDLTGLASAQPSACDGLEQLQCPLSRSMPCPVPISTGKLSSMLELSPQHTRQKEWSRFHSTIATRRAAITATPQATPRWHSTPEGQGALRELCETRAKLFLQGCIKPLTLSAVHVAKLVIRISTELADRSGDGSELVGTSHSWYHVASGSAQAGPVPFRMNFIKLVECDEEQGDDDDDLLLVTARLPKVQTRRPLPFGGEVGVGMLQHNTYADAIAMALESGDPAHHAVAVEFARFSNAWVLGDRFRIGRQDGATPPLRVSVDDLAPDSNAAPSAEEKGEPDIDWEKQALPKQRRPRAPRPSGGHGGPVAAAICDEPVFGWAVSEMVEDLLGEASMELRSSVGELPEDGSASDQSKDGGEGEGDSDHAGGDEEGDAMPEEVARPALEVTPANCIETLQTAADTNEVFAALPAFGKSLGWDILRTDVVPPVPIAKIRCIVGRSFRADCKVHSGPGAVCKYHLNISGQFARAEAAVVRWCTSGIAMTPREHAEACKRCTELFRGA